VTIIALFQGKLNHCNELTPIETYAFINYTLSMKGLLSTAGKIGLLSLLSLLSFSAQPLNTPQELVIGGYRLPFDAPPYQWLSPCTGQVDGSLPHLVTKYLKEIGIKARYYDYSKENDEVNFQSTINSLINDKFDASMGFSRNFGSKKIKTTRQPVITTEQAAIYYQNYIKIDSFDDLKSLRGVLNLGELEPSTNPSYQFAVANQLKFVTTASKEDSFRLLTERKADYMIGDYYRTLLLAKDKQLQSKLAFFRLDEMQRGFYFAVAKDGKWNSLVDALDEYLATKTSQQGRDVLNKAYLSKWLSRFDCKKNNTAPN